MYLLVYLRESLWASIHPSQNQPKNNRLKNISIFDFMKYVFSKNFIDYGIWYLVFFSAY